MEHGAGFALHVDADFSQFEGFTFDEPWPDRLGTFRLRYADGDGRPRVLEEIDRALGIT